MKIIIVSLITLIILSIVLYFIFKYTYYSFLVVLYSRLREKKSQFIPLSIELLIMGATFSLLLFELFLICRWYSFILLIVLDTFILSKIIKDLTENGVKYFFSKVLSFIWINLYLIVLILLAITLKLPEFRLLHIALLDIILVWITTWIILRYYIDFRKDKYLGAHKFLNMFGMIGIILILSIYILCIY